jgi:hypothetical protein
MKCPECELLMDEVYEISSKRMMVFGQSYIPVYLYQCPYCKTIKVGKRER